MGNAALLKAFALYRTYHGSASRPGGADRQWSRPGATSSMVDNRAQYLCQVRRGHPILAEVYNARPTPAVPVGPRARRAGSSPTRSARELLALVGHGAAR